jgi:hypothetical protein
MRIPSISLRSRALLATITLLASLVIAAAPAAAHSKPKPSHVRMLSFKPCNGTLSGEDFNDNLVEVAPTSVSSAPGVTAKTSVCKYASTSADGSGDFHVFTGAGELGVECLANVFKMVKEGVDESEIKAGGCWRIDNASVLYSYGPKVEKLLAKLKKGARASSWPPGFGRHVLKGVGDTAEYGYDASSGDGYGYLRIDNAELFVETTEGENPSMVGLLREAATTL